MKSIHKYLGALLAVLLFALVVPVSFAEEDIPTPPPQPPPPVAPEFPPGGSPDDFAQLTEAQQIAILQWCAYRAIEVPLGLRIAMFYGRSGELPPGQELVR